MSSKRFLKRMLAAALVLVLGLSISVGATSTKGETKDKASNTSLSDAKEEIA